MCNKRTAAFALLAAVLASPETAAAQSLRICAAEDEMPYASRRSDGFEDRLGDVLARAMGATVERVGFSDPRFVVRDLLDKGKCDVMLGVDENDPRLETTRAYYRSTYVFVTRTRDKLDVRDWSSPVLQKTRIGVIPGTPAETMLVQIGRYPASFSYLMALGGNKAPRNRYVRYDVEKLIRDVGDGTIDVAVAWLPSVARYIQGSKEPLAITAVPEAKRSNGEPVKFEFATAIGVRKGDKALLERVQSALERAAGDVDKVLADEGITPLNEKSQSGAVTNNKENG